MAKDSYREPWTTPLKIYTEFEEKEKRFSTKTYIPEAK
jgi:hypothetical protein